MSAFDIPDDDCVVYTDDEDGDSEVTGVTVDHVSEFIAQSKGFGDVIQCRTPSGDVVEYLPYLAESVGSTIWIRSGVEHSNIVEEQAVHNMVRLCNPDVQLVEEDDSKWFSPDAGTHSEVGP